MVGTRNWIVATSTACTLALGAYGCAVLSRTDVAEPPKRVVTTATTTSTTTTSSTTTTTSTTTTSSTIPDGPPSALTGYPTTKVRALEIVNRPALVIKIDNSTAAMPQAGLNLADVVLELRVEGISRLAAVFHSKEAAQVGPVRSARSSDPTLLGVFGYPSFGWSGANDTVLSQVYGTPWLNNVNWDRAAGAYSRTGGRRAPHNLFTSTDALTRYTRTDQPGAHPIFLYLQGDAKNPTATPASKVDLAVGSTGSSWRWESDRWVRSQYGRQHLDVSGDPVTADNVVILETDYVAGSSPVAWTVAAP